MKTILSVLALSMLLHASGAHKVAELVKLPHPLKALISKEKLAELNVTKTQENRLENEVMAIFPNQMHTYFDEAETIENRIKKAVILEGKDTTAVAKDLEALSRVKLSMTKQHIDALNVLQNILTKEQFKRLLQTTH